MIANQTLRFHKHTSKPTEVLGKGLLASVLLVHRGRMANAKVRVEERSRAERSLRRFEGEIRQVLSNLISNATDAMGERGGGRLLARCRDSHDWSTVREGLTFTIADAGPGMSSESREKAFEAFYTTKGLEGTGLGLWVSAELVARHEGRLRLRTSQTPGRSGTVFTLFLPYAAVTR